MIAPRLLRYFVAVAEHLGRVALRLLLGSLQPRLFRYFVAVIEHLGRVALRFSISEASPRTERPS